MVDFLISKGADVNAVADFLYDPGLPKAYPDCGMTPLHLAALAGHSEMARLLLYRGADPSIKDSRHDGDAMDWARFFRRKEIVAMLEARIAPGR